MDKFYQLKLFDNDGTEVKTLNPRTEFGDKKFSSIINGWASNMEFCFDVSIDDTTVSGWQFIKVIQYDENNKSGTTIYIGYVERIRRILTNKGEYVCIECIGLYALMKRVIYKASSNRVHTKTDDPWDIVSDIVSAFNTAYGWSWLSVWSIDTYWSNVSIEFDNRSCADAIKDVRETVQNRGYFYIAGDGQVYFKQNPSTSTYKLKMWPEIERMEITEKYNIVNTVWVEYTWWSEETDTDSTSITNYWLSEEKLTRADIQNSATADQLAEQYVDANKDMIPEIIIDVVNRTDLENMRPWQLVTVYNSAYGVTDKQINKVVYNEKKVTLYLESFESFGNEFLS